MNLKRKPRLPLLKGAVALAVSAGLVLSGGGIANASSLEGNADSSAPENLTSSVSTRATDENTVLSSSGPDSSFIGGITLPGNAVTDNAALEAADTTSTNLETVLGEKFDGTGAPLATTTVDGAELSSFATDNGSQTIISIASAQAPTEYRFPLTLPEGTSPRLNDDGSVSVIDANGAELGGVETPWATDANGNTIPTRFALDGNTLVQTIEFSSKTAFPVTADPKWWQWPIIAAATGAVTAAVAAIPGVGPAVAGAAGGCAGSALKAKFDGKNGWSVLKSCLAGAALGGAAGMVKSVVTNVIAKYMKK